MKIKIYRRWDAENSLWSIAFYCSVKLDHEPFKAEYYSPVFIFSPKGGSTLKEVLRQNISMFTDSLISQEKSRKKMFTMQDLLLFKQVFEALKLPDTDRAINIGSPCTVGRLKQILKHFPDDLDFGFRNQPMQQLVFISRDGYNCLVFEEK